MNNCGCNNNRIITPDCDMKRWEVECSSYIEDADNYYTKKEVDDLIESATTSGNCCITEEQVDAKIASAKTEIEAEIPTVPTSNTAFTNDAGYITGVDLSNYATLDDVDRGDKIVHNEVQEVDGKVQTVSGDVKTLSGSVNDVIETVDDIAEYIETVNSALTAHTADTSIHLTSGDVQTQIDNSISGKADISYVDQSVSGKQSTLTAGRAISLNNNTVAFNLPVYKGSGDTNVSICIENGNLQGQNKINSTFGAGIGWGLITQNTGESSIGSYNKSSTDNVQTYGSSGKTCFTIGNGTSNGHRHNALEIRENGDIYIADTSASGQGYEKPMIKLQDNIGGGSGTTYTAGDGIDITNNVISTTTKFWCGTQLEYDQIQTKDLNTVYMIH